MESIEKMTDAELYELLIELDSKNISLLPVIINNNSFDDINQKEQWFISYKKKFCG